MKKLKKPLNLILASTRTLGIGYKNNLPWPHLKSDMKFFQKITTGEKNNSVIMGMNTFASMNYSPLKNRKNIIITSKTEKELEKYRNEDIQFFKTLEEAIKFCEDDKKIKENYIIGGAKLFDYILEKQENFKIKNLFWTRIFQNFETDTNINRENFNKLKQTLGIPKISKTMVTDNKINYDLSIYGELSNKNLKFKKSEEYQYIDLLKKILKTGKTRSDRTNTGILSTFGNSMRYDLSSSFPLLTTKSVFFKGVVEELIWFIKGQTDGNILKKKGIDIWNGNGSREFLDKRGLQKNREMDLGPIYGFQWRNFGAEYINCDESPKSGIDQLKAVINSLKNDPTSRRHVISAWNPVDLDKMALPPCHIVFQFYVDDGNKLSCALYQRSCDVGLGLPFNIASYSLLVCILADFLGMERGEFVHFIGDTHVYLNHKEALEKQVKRRPRPFPVLNVRRRERNGIEDYCLEDFELLNYFPQKAINMKMAV